MVIIKLGSFHALLSLPALIKNMCTNAHIYVPERSLKLH